MDIGATTRKDTPPLSSPKASAVPNRSLSGSRETNENEQPLDQKPMTKNFMSPTISASSKASIPIRKKILSERNEISSSCESLPPHKASNLGSKTKSLNSTSHHSGKLPISSYSYASEPENDHEINSVVDSSYKPYDPLTNDLGPRPKYLRYKPNRRRMTFLDLQKCHDNQGSLQQAEDSSNLPEKDNLEPEDDEDVADSVDDDDEEMEEDVLDREWSLRGLFKILLLLVVFLLSGSNLSSMNSVVSSGSGYMIRKNIFEAVFHEIYGSGTAYVDQPEYLGQREANYEVKAVEFVEDIVEFLNVASAEMEKITEPHEVLSVGIDIVDQDSTELEVTQSVHGDEEEENMSTAAGEVTSSNKVDEEEVEGSDEQLQKDQVLEKKDPNIYQIPLNLEALLDDISSTCGAHSSYKIEQAEPEKKVEQELSETELEGAEQIDTEFETSNLDTEIESENAEVKEIRSSNTVIIIGVSAASVLLVASLVTIYVTRKPKASIVTPQAGVEQEHLERKTETSVEKVSSLHEPLNGENLRNSHLERTTPAIGSITQASSLCGPTKEASKVISHISAPKVSSLHEPLNGPSENLRNSHLERTTPAIGSITQASSLCGPTKEASKAISHISAPKIELLGEMMVGEVSSSSLRICVKKNSFIEAEGSNTNLSKGVLPPAQPSVVDLTDSPSYGSFTAEKKFLKKKVERDGEEVKKVVLTTPVRRSSRIRDRVGMSP
ncbi:hypothetical protein RND71_029213 [Anisodus tanguticus]|uniref:Uncharacterized protein n=1 Tax=Anisodus tanguticus TaxID=243964 RepID=A0AAE1V701_9SOLA|nr:hypothetical protein RND71_029213 [Anisodus tanguticus]